MLVTLTNICGGELVCDLKTLGKTLRLQNRESIDIVEEEITPHIETLKNKGLLLVKYKKSQELEKESKKKSGVNTKVKKED